MAPPPMMNDEVHHGNSRPSHLRRRFSIVRVIFGEEFWLLVLCQKGNLGASNDLKMVYEQAQKIRDEQGDTFLAVIAEGVALHIIKGGIPLSTA